MLSKKMENIIDIESLQDSIDSLDALSNIKKER